MLSLVVKKLIGLELEPGDELTQDVDFRDGFSCHPLAHLLLADLMIEPELARTGKFRDLKGPAKLCLNAIYEVQIKIFHKKTTLSCDISFILEHILIILNRIKGI